MTEMARVKYLEQMSAKARVILNDLKVPYREKTPVGVGSFKSHYGICTTRRYPSGQYRYNIEIAKWLIDTKNEDAIINTIIHEYLHTIDPKAHHGGAWKKYANLVSKKTQYKIQRVSSYEEKQILEEQIDYKYKSVCQDCGKVYYNNRMCKFIKNRGEGYHCGSCKGHNFKFYDSEGNEI